MSSDIYDENYFIHGQESGKSLYTDYRWMPELTIPMVQAIVNHCGINKGEIILDYGCARGYVVKAFHQLGYGPAYGYDISEWAIKNCDPDVKDYVACLIESEQIGFKYDWIIAKDVLEHIVPARSTINQLMQIARKGIFVVVPLSDYYHGPYVVEEYEKDVTHEIRWPLLDWAKCFMRPGWSVEASYRVKGVKDNYYKEGWEMGNGFITARRIEE